MSENLKAAIKEIETGVYRYAGMYVVYTEDGERHSAWDNKREALHQKEVLEDHGYKDVYIEYEDIEEENSHYFV